MSEIKKRYFRLANPEASFYDAITELDLFGKKIGELDASTTLPTPLLKRIKDGHITELTHDEAINGASKEDITPMGNKIEPPSELETDKANKELADKVEELEGKTNEELIELAEETDWDVKDLKTFTSKLKSKKSEEAIAELAAKLLATV